MGIAQKKIKKQNISKSIDPRSMIKSL